MKPTAFERQMIRHHLHPATPAMTLKGITILIALVGALLYAAMDCGLF